MTANLVDAQGSLSSTLHPNAADILISYLENIGVKYVFGVPGGAIEPLYDALARAERGGKLNSVVARHETGAAFMAEGYARNSGKLGVVCSTTGPGATNLITGVACAYENSTPMLVITAQTALKHFGRKAFQESGDTGVNVVGMMQFCTHFNSMVTHIEQFEQKLVTAIMTAMGSPGGPVHLSVPVDILRAHPHPPKTASNYNLDRLFAADDMHNSAALSRLCLEIKSAKRPVFVLGSGCRDAASAILDIATTINALIVTTPEGKGLISPYHPLYRGVIGFAGHRSAHKLLVDESVDLIVAIGALFGEWSSNGWDDEALFNDRMVHVDQLEPNLLLTPMAKLHVPGNIPAICEALRTYVHREFHPSSRMVIRDETRQHLQKQSIEREKIEQIQHFELGDMRKYFDDSIPIKPQWLMHKLPQLLPPSAIYLADTGNSVAWAIHYLHPFDRRMMERRNRSRVSLGRRVSRAGLFQCTLEYAPMGWAIGNAIGVSLAQPGEVVVCITGDGSVLMNGQEITVANQLELPIVFVILNDSSLGMVRHGQRLAGAEEIGTELPNVDFGRFAQSMGVAGYQVKTPSDLIELNFEAICARKGPTVIDVLVDKNEVPPMNTRMKVLADSSADE